MEAVAAGETSFPAVLDCTRYETCCLQCISLPPSPSSPRNTQQHSKIDALVDLQPYQRDLNSHCHKSSGILQSPHSSPHQVLVSQSTTTTHCTPRTLLWGSEEALTGTQLFRTHSADTWPHGAVGWREPRSWLLSGVYHPIMCLCPCQTPLHTVPVLAAAQNSQGNF